MKHQGNQYIIWGCKGQAKVLAEIIVTYEHGEITAFFEQDKTITSFIADIPTYYGIEGYKKWLSLRDISKNISAIAAIGGSNGQTRIEYMMMFERDGLFTPTLIHPTATILSGVIIGKNCQILTHAVIGIDTVLGDACIVNTSASVDHECIVSDGVHVAPGVTLCGEVFVGTCSFVGAGAVVLPRIKIGSNAIIGAGSVVTHDIPNNVIAFGNPARIIKENEYV